MLQDDVKVVSVDDRVIEHPGVWGVRVPAKFVDTGASVQRSSARRRMVVAPRTTIAETTATPDLCAIGADDPGRANCFPDQANRERTL